MSMMFPNGRPMGMADQFQSLANFGIPNPGDFLTGPLQELTQAPQVASIMASPVSQQLQPDAGMGGGGGGGSIWDSFLGKTDAKGIKTDGWGGMALGAAGALGSAFMGMQQYGLMKKQLAEGKRQFNLNYDAQKRTTNSALEDRQRARLASNSGAYESLSSYMDKNGIR